MTRKALSQTIRQYFKPTPLMKNDPMYMVSEMYRWFDGIDELFDFRIIALQGFRWAWSTGRLSGMVEHAIAELTPAKFREFLVRCQCECESMNDVPRWLNQNAPSH